jgi:BMFP domain-containing protein YqiC
MSDQKESSSIEIGGVRFTGGKMLVVITALTSTIGALYAGFEVYKDYMDMKKQIQEYVSPDLSGINQKIAVLEENSAKAVEYTRDINNGLKSDIRRIETVLDSVERNAKQSQRDVDTTVRSVTQQINQLERDNAQELRTIRSELDKKIQKALDNPLAR